MVREGKKSLVFPFILILKVLVIFIIIILICGREQDVHMKTTEIVPLQ